MIASSVNGPPRQVLEESARAPNLVLQKVKDSLFLEECMSSGGNKNFSLYPTP